MKFKSLSIFLIVSSFFLTCILSIWKIMSTLQGLSFTNLNITPIFLIGILLSLAFVLIGNKINHLIKIFLLTGGASGTRTLPINVYQQGFAVSDIGMGSAVSIVIVMLLLSFMIIYFRLIGKKANEV